MIDFTLDEMKQLMVVIDGFVRANGVRGASTAVDLAAKVEAAMSEVTKPKKEEQPSEAA